VVDAYHIGKSSFRKTVQNVSLAFAFNGIGIPAAVTGLVHPVWAMIAMAASVTIVLLNSFGGRLLTTPSPKREEVKTHAVKLEVPSMHCQGCEQEVRDAVLNVKGVKAVEVDLRRKLVSITIGDGNEDKIRREIVKIGHTVH
jgi:cation transport ATPase